MKIETCQAALDVASSAGDEAMKAKAHFDLGIACQHVVSRTSRGSAPYSTHLHKSIEHLSHARTLYTRIGNSAMQVRALTCLGDAYLANGEEEKGFSHYGAALDTAKASGDEATAAKVHFDLGILHQGRFDATCRGHSPDLTSLAKAIEHLSQADHLYMKIGDADMRGLALANLAIAHCAKGEKEIAIEYFRWALDIAKTLDFPDWEQQTINRFSRLLGQMLRLSEANELISEYAVRRQTRGRPR